MTDSVLHEISKIKFGILSSKEIKDYATVEITNGKVTVEQQHAGGTVYDPRMGPTKGNCVQCGLDTIQCNGHMGYINLKKPLINPIFLSHVVILLKFVCFHCHQFVLNKQHMQLRGLSVFSGKRRFVELCELFKRLVLCVHCQHVQPDYKICLVDTIPCIFSIQENDRKMVTPEECLLRFENVSDDEVRLMGFDPTLVHPKSYIMTRFPIIPTCCRPYIVNDGQFNDDDLTYQLVEIVKNNLSVCETNAKYYNNLMFRVSTYFNNTGKKAKHATTGRAIKGIRERIGGKEGYIRNNLLGKRVNQSARTVIGPDPYIDMETLVVPRYMSTILTIPEQVFELNKKVVDGWFASGLINYIVKPDGRKINVSKHVHSFIISHGDVLIFPNGVKHVVMDTRMNVPEGTMKLVDGALVCLEESIKPTVCVGDVVHRQLMDGDFVMLNRQPTLHKASMMALRCKILDVKTLKINLAISRPFNCDFDGDEMNIHVPQSLESRIELESLSVPSQCVISTQAGKPNMCIVQDTLSASYLISKRRDEPLSRGRFFQIMMTSNVVHTLVKKSHYTFIDIIDSILPRTLNFKTRDLHIENGRLLRGVLNKKYLGSSHTSLIKIIYHYFGITPCLDFINNIQFVCNQWLMYYGFTVHAEDCLRVGGNNEDTIQQYMIEAEMSRLTYHHPVVRENKIIESLSKAKDIGMKIAKENLKLSNNFLTTVESGSKGDYFNISQITGLLGQQIIHNGRIHGTMNDGARTLPHCPLNTTLSLSDEYKFKGFIKNSFESGLDPIEFFFHSMSGRKGVSDTALSTASSGYCMRRVVKLTEDLTIQYDGTVRDVNKRLYQMCYNQKGYDSTKIYKDSLIHF